jgi:carbonic anhydrase/acetyltransferase-like protein (isoleucine patch superfamily)
MRGVDLISFNGRAPRVDSMAWIAPGCRIIGDVEIGPLASIWYNCVVRADVNKIRIGAGTNVQDGTIIHCDSGGSSGPGHPTIIGEGVLIGHMAVIHGATLMAGSFVGIGAIAMDGSTLEPGSMLAAGALLTPHKRVPSQEIWAGRPAKALRSLTDEEAAKNAESVLHYQKLSQAHRQAIAAEPFAAT